MICTLSLTNVDSKVFSVQIELLDTVALNLHRIDKDVQRCDRNYYYFTTANLEKLRNIMCRYVVNMICNVSHLCSTTVLHL